MKNNEKIPQSEAARAADAVKNKKRIQFRGREAPRGCRGNGCGMQRLRCGREGGGPPARLQTGQPAAMGAAWGERLDAATRQNPRTSTHNIPFYGPTGQ